MILLYEWMMLFVRAGGLIALLPAISAAPVPPQVRVAIAGFLAYAATGFVHLQAGLPADAGGLVIALVHELLIGLLMGFGARLIFYAVEFAGQLISTEMGMTLSTHIDPFSHNNSTSVSTLLFYLSV